MTEEWFVRVEGKEYGPVGVDALREWKREGRLIPANEIRRVGDNRWISAGELVEVFEDTEPEPPPLPPRTLIGSEILAADFHRDFSDLSQRARPVPAFWPAYFGADVRPAVDVSRSPFPDLSSGPYTIPSPALPPVSVAMLIVLLFVWPVSAAGFQFVADDILRGEPRSFRAQFSAALRCWARMLTAAILVYGSYFFWFFLPFAVMLALISGQISVGAIRCQQKKTTYCLMCASLSPLRQGSTMVAAFPFVLAIAIALSQSVRGACFLPSGSSSMSFGKFVRVWVSDG